MIRGAFLLNHVWCSEKVVGECAVGVLDAAHGWVHATFKPASQRSRMFSIFQYPDLSALCGTALRHLLGQHISRAGDESALAVAWLEQLKFDGR